MKKAKKDKHFIKKPVYPGGLKAMREFIAKEMKYPKEALKYKKEGIVKIKFDIDYKGKVFDSIILSSLGYGCDEEAERIVKLLKFNVEKTRKMKVVFHKSLQIKFKLPKEKKQAPPKPKTPKITSVQYNYVTTKNLPEKTVVPKKSKIYNYTLNIK